MRRKPLSSSLCYLHLDMAISLSILGYESKLSRMLNNLEGSRAFSEIVRMVKSGMLHSLHIDVMRPNLIPGRTRFQTDLIKELYERLGGEIPFRIHLMMKEPLRLLEEINRFIGAELRRDVSVILQREAYTSEDEMAREMEVARGMGYGVGVSLDLPSPLALLGEVAVRRADFVLLMTVPMGRGGQEYSPKANSRIAEFSKRFPEVPIWVDGGLKADNILAARDAGASGFVVGSFITDSRNPLEALKRLREILD